MKYLLRLVWVVSALFIATPALAATAPLQGTVWHVQPGSNIQSTINSAASGDTIFFDPGTYNVSGITLKSGQLYEATIGTAILHGSGVIFGINSSNSHDIIVDGLTFDGGNFDLSANSTAAGVADHITIQNNTFQNATYFAGNAALESSYLKNSTIDHNSFINLPGGSGSAINGYDYDNVRITYNLCQTVYQCLSATFENVANTGRNVYVGYNAGTGMERMGLEFQDTLGPNGPGISSQNLIIENNWFANWSTSLADGERIAYSSVQDKGIGAIIRNNYASCGSAGHCVIGIEAAGTGANVTGNYLDSVSGIISYEPGNSFTNNNVIGANCSGDGCISLFAQNGVTSANTVISGNTSNSNLARPAMPSAGAGNGGGTSSGGGGGGGSSSGGGTPAPTPVPTPGPTPCINYFQPGIAVPSGFGAAYDLFGSAALLVAANCNKSIPTLDIGRGSTSDYVYKLGYVYQGSAWQPLNLSASTALVSQNWYLSSASSNLPSSVDYTNWTYAVGYVCSYINSSWKCGCADATCSTGMWQLQAFKR